MLKLSLNPCTNQDLLYDYEKKIADLDQTERENLIQLSDGSCFDINELVQFIIAGDGANRNPVNHQGQIWNTEQELNEILNHPKLEQQFKDQLKQIILNKNIDDLFIKYPTLLSFIGECGIQMLSDYSDTYVYSTDILGIVSQTIDTIGEDLGLKMRNLSNSEGKTLNQTLESADDTCIHGIGYQFMSLYCNTLIQNKHLFTEVDEHPGIIHIEDNVYLFGYYSSNDTNRLWLGIYAVDAPHSLRTGGSGRIGYIYLPNITRDTIELKKFIDKIVNAEDTFYGNYSKGIITKLELQYPDKLQKFVKYFMLRKDLGTPEMKYPNGFEHVQVPLEPEPIPEVINQVLPPPYETRPYGEHAEKLPQIDRDMLNAQLIKLKDELEEIMSKKDDFPTVNPQVVGTKIILIKEMIKLFSYPGSLGDVYYSMRDFVSEVETIFRDPLQRIRENKPKLPVVADKPLIYRDMLNSQLIKLKDDFEEIMSNIDDFPTINPRVVNTKITLVKGMIKLFSYPDDRWKDAYDSMRDFVSEAETIFRDELQRIRENKPKLPPPAEQPLIDRDMLISQLKKLKEDLDDIMSNIVDFPTLIPQLVIKKISLIEGMILVLSNPEELDIPPDYYRMLDFVSQTETIFRDSLQKIRGNKHELPPPYRKPPPPYQLPQELPRPKKKTRKRKTGDKKKNKQNRDILVSQLETLRNDFEEIMLNINDFPTVNPEVVVKKISIIEEFIDSLKNPEKLEENYSERIQDFISEENQIFVDEFRQLREKEQPPEMNRCRILADKVYKKRNTMKKQMKKLCMARNWRQGCGLPCLQENTTDTDYCDLHKQPKYGKITRLRPFHDRNKDLIEWDPDAMEKEIVVKDGILAPVFNDIEDISKKELFSSLKFIFNEHLLKPVNNLLKLMKQNKDIPLSIYSDMKTLIDEINLNLREIEESEKITSKKKTDLHEFKNKYDQVFDRLYVTYDHLKMLVENPKSIANIDKFMMNKNEELELPPPKNNDWLKVAQKKPVPQQARELVQPIQELGVENRTNRRIVQQNRTLPNSEKNVILVLQSTHDPKNAFDEDGDKGLFAIFQSMSSFDFKYHKISKYQDIIDAVNSLGPQQKIAHLVMMAHGDQKIMVIGNNHFLCTLPYSDKNMTSLRDFSELLKPKIEKNMSIFLHSCLVGKGGPGQDNFANHLSVLLPNHLIFAAENSIARNELIVKVAEEDNENKILTMKYIVDEGIQNEIYDFYTGKLQGGNKSKKWKVYKL